jgi:hypothetical protein
MQRTILIFGLACFFGGSAAHSAIGQTQFYSVLPPDSSIGGSGEVVDGIVARIEDDVLTESEMRELAGFQRLVDGRAKSRADLIQELSDQWIVRSEVGATQYPSPSVQDVDRAYVQLVKQFASSEEFARRRIDANLTELEVRDMLKQQLYLARFLDYRFRPAAQVDDQQIESYYKNELSPQLVARKESVPPLPDVAETIREVLVQREIDDRATKWLDDSRQQLKIEVLPAYPTQSGAVRRNGGTGEPGGPGGIDR